MQTIRRAGDADLEILSDLALQLWPNHIRQDFIVEFSDLLHDPNAVVFLAYVSDAPAGFAQCQLRHDYVEGTDSSPVGYLEGIFIREQFRHAGLAKELLHECENWARNQGCRAFASDCELENSSSLAFHLALGFKETNRIICFAKQLS